MAVLDKVKSALGITGEYQNATLNVYIDEVIAYMISAGVPEEVANSDVSAGVIARGVTDLWDYNSNGGKLSDWFCQRVSQLYYSVNSGKYIVFNNGDYGMSYPVYIEGVDITPTDIVVFKCDQLTKEFTNVSDNCVVITFTESESESLVAGEYQWTLKLSRLDAVVTLVNDGVLVVR